jgi:L,D-transpeptidase ErfK/SrfK
MIKNLLENKINIGLLLAAIVFLFALLLVFTVTNLSISKIERYSASTAFDNDIESKADLLSKKINEIDAHLKSKAPKGNYIIINSSANEFVLRNNAEVLRKDKCSTGSYILLKKGNNQSWMFKTPKGEFKILNKKKAPVWKKPDWAFVEAGTPVPSMNHPSRFEYGVLGDYSLAIGDGYLIHGTLYQRFLGLPVTHGCIRLNDANLELVYKSLAVGSKVYIF